MTDVNRDVNSTITDIAGKNWADLCDSSQSSQSNLDTDSPLKNNEVCAKDNEEEELYDLVFQPIKKETVQDAPQDDLSLTSFMNNVHMVTPIKQENIQHPSNVIIDEDTICSPFIKEESTEDTVELKSKITHVKSEIEKLKKETKEILHVKRRLTSESESTVSDLKTPERVNKVHKKSTDHKNIHDSKQSPKLKLERETDPLVIARRQKQIDFGKNTIGYELYLENVPKHKRTKQHPKTPPKNLKFTRRAWDGLVKNWRVKLHCWDPDNKCNDDDALTTGSSSNLCSLQLEHETDPLVLARRQKQIDFGKNTIGYELYLENVPKYKRTKQHPKTPPKKLKFTRRSWDGLVKNWRIKLHKWDPVIKNEIDDALITSSSSNLCSPESKTSLDSNVLASNSQPSLTQRSSEYSSQVKRELEAVSSPDPVKFKKIKIEY